MSHILLSFPEKVQPAEIAAKGINKDHKLTFNWVNLNVNWLAVGYSVVIEHSQHVFKRG